MRRVILSSLLAMLLSAPALAGPEDILTRLYDGFPYATNPPGEESFWTSGLYAQWIEAEERVAAARASGADPRGDGLTFNVLNASQEDYIGGVSIGSPDWTVGYADVEVRVDNGGDAPVILIYEFVLEGEWRIADIHRRGAWRLTELLAETR